MQQVTYRHSNGNYYRIIDHCRIQINGEWTDAYIYVEADKFRSVYAVKYVRTIVEFHQKFTPVLDEQELLSISDGESLLDKIRQGQLSDILGRFKLF